MSIGEMQRGRRNGVRGSIAAIAAALLLVAPAAAPAKGHKTIGIKVGGQQDKTLLAAGKLRATLRSGRSRRVTLTTATLDSGESALTKPKGVRLDRGRNKVALPLSAEGEELLEGCGAEEVTLRATVKRGKRSKTVGRRSAEIDRGVAQCAALANADRCETIADPGIDCLFPWPSDHLTVADPTSGTGRRLNIAQASAPANHSGVHIDTTDLNRSDGFSPGVSIVTRIPGLDTPAAMNQTGAVPLTDIARAFDPAQPIVLIDASTKQRQLIWAELDSNASGPSTTDLIIRVGRNLIEGHRYIVALRNLKDSSGNTIPAPPGFALYRDNIRTRINEIEARRAHFEQLFSELAAAGIARSDLHSAWDFTVASTENITGRMLSIRDRALADLGDTSPDDGVIDGDAPDYTITDVKTTNAAVNPLTGSHTTENVREVTGTYQVPCFLDTDGCDPGSRFTIGPDGLPVRTPGNMMTARFTCNIPKSLVHETTPGNGDWVVDKTARTSMYGHGLFGDYTEVHTGDVRQLGTENDVITCATDFSGMSENDLVAAALALLDLSHFPPIPDGLQQGFLNFIYLGRLLANPDGFADDPAFEFNGQPVIDPAKGLFYYGNSQGGIAGGALTAVEPDITRTVLYVPAMNYSTLLTRSIDFRDYAEILYPSYPNEAVRPLLLSMIQTMWDRGEPNGYANHMTSDPLPDTPAHNVMIEMAWGDHQVSNAATVVESRTIGAPLRYPTLDPGRAP